MFVTKAYSLPEEGMGDESGREQAKRYGTANHADQVHVGMCQLILYSAVT